MKPIWLAGVMVAASLAGCAMPLVESDELPASPIALVYRSPGEARERAEELERRQGKSEQTAEGVMKLNDADQYLARIRGRAQDLPPRLQGRLALLMPRSGEIEELEAFQPGSVPFDWDPTRTRLLAVSRQRGTPALYAYTPADRRLSSVLRGHQPRIEGVFGPDGRVAYVEAGRVAGGQLALSIWTTTRAGGPVQATAGPADGGVQWSPDGRWLLFHAPGQRGHHTIYALDMEEGGEPTLIARGAEPSISPLGDWVVFAREMSGGWRLWRMRIDGTGKSPLGGMPQEQADERQPSVSPDGRYVVYVAESENRQRLRIRRIDGTGDRLLLERGDGAVPVW